MAKARKAKAVDAIRHQEASRANIPTAEFQSLMTDDDRSPVRVAYQRRNRDLDPQLVWRGKDEQDWSDLVVHAPPLFIQEKVHPKALIEDLRRQTEQARRREEEQSPGFMSDLFADFNGLPEGDARTEFYQHAANWSNRMILGDSLQVMASLAEREGLGGKVQCIYIDPPYGIKFNSNFQWSTTSRDVKDGKAEHITREPEQVKAFRDTWRDGIHSYLTYLRDRLTVARDLLTESGSIFVQIGDENVHRVRALMDEVFGEENFVSTITIRKTTSEGASLIGSTTDFVIWYGKTRDLAKFRPIFKPRSQIAESRYSSVDPKGRRYRLDNITSSRPAGEGDLTSYIWRGHVYGPGAGTFKTTDQGLERLSHADRLHGSYKGKLNYRRFHNDFSVAIIGNLWTDISGAVQSRSDPKVYVVQSSTQLIQRCILMTTDPGDLVLDPTCGSGTTAYVAEQWGRRWIAIDTSRVALALARARIMGARYPYYLLADSRAGQIKEAEISRINPSDQPAYEDIRQGFVYQRVPHITLRSIANNAEIDVIHEQRQPAVDAALVALNEALAGCTTPFEVVVGGRKGTSIHFSAPVGQTATLRSGETAPANRLLEWEVPREAPATWPVSAAEPLAAFWEARIARQKEIDASIAAKGDFEVLYDKPYEDKAKVRVAGPFTVESLSPHRVLHVDENGEFVESVAEGRADYRVGGDFTTTILEHLRTAGVQQAKAEDKIVFSSLTPWPGEMVCAKGGFTQVGESDHEAAQIRSETSAAIFIGPEFGTVSRPDLVAAAREATEAGFEVLIACAFSFDAQASDLNKLGNIPILKARMNADLHMATDLRNTGKGNLFVIFGEPDIDILPAPTHNGTEQVQVKINGVDVYHPSSGDIRSDSAEGIACWFIDTDYNEESFFVRHAYFLGANDPYKALKTSLKAEVDADAWAGLHSDTSRPFDKPASGRIAVKVINHLGDEVMKVFRV